MVEGGTTPNQYIGVVLNKMCNTRALSYLQECTH